MDFRKYIKRLIKPDESEMVISHFVLLFLTLILNMTAGSKYNNIRCVCCHMSHSAAKITSFLPNKSKKRDGDDSTHKQVNMDFVYNYWDVVHISCGYIRYLAYISPWELNLLLSSLCFSVVYLSLGAKKFARKSFKVLLLLHLELSFMQGRSLIYFWT